MPEKYRLFLWAIGAFLVLFLGWVIYTPIPFTALKLAAVISALMLLVGAGVLFKHGKWFGFLALSAFSSCAFWPSSQPNTSQLRARYLNALLAYQGTPYVWGGENGRGIDCSGLIRRAMIDALVAQGWQDRNPASWRQAASIWWFDCSASAMKNGYNGQIEPLLAVNSLNALDTSRLRRGDLAVTQSGVHVLAFVGGKTWIQADPNLVNGGDKVIVTTAPSTSGWFGQPVQICRWKTLSDGLRLSERVR